MTSWGRLSNVNKEHFGTFFQNAVNIKTCSAFSIFQNEN